MGMCLSVERGCGCVEECEERSGYRVGRHG